MNSNDYAEIGLMVEWHLERRPEWRGFDLFGLSTDGQRVYQQFIPDAAFGAILAALEKEKSAALTRAK